MAGRVNFGLWYDYRNPATSELSFEQLYRENLEQIQHAETRGFDSVWLTEHHFRDDGYTPSPLVIAAAIANATRAMRIGTNLLLLPLYHPVRVAEDAATLAILSNGRFDLGVGAGYVEREYQVFGRRLQQRPSLMEEGIATIRQAWSGEPIELQGRRYRFEQLPVTPVPRQRPRLLMGAVAEPAIERAARLADGFLCSGGIGRDHYLKAGENLGRDPAGGAIYSGSWSIVAADPDRARAELGPCLVHQMRSYQSMGSFGGSDAPAIDHPEAAIEQGFYEFWTPDEAIERITAELQAYPQTRDIHFWGRFPGESQASAVTRINLIADRVLPRVRQSLETRSTK